METTFRPKLILAAVDGSPQSTHAAQHAVDLARSCSAKVVLITVVRPPEGWWGIEGAPPDPEAFARAVTGHVEILNQTLEAIDADGVDVETREEIGDPTGMLLEACSALEADLIVVGRRGAGIMERVLMGSVTDRLAHLAPCPVLIVP